MRLVVFSHKLCWPSDESASGYVTDGGFPFQMQAVSELFSETTLVVPCAAAPNQVGVTPLTGYNLSVAPLTAVSGSGLKRKLKFPLWLARNCGTLLREIRRADAVHTPIPGDVGTIGMLMAFIMRKPLFVRHCGNWLAPKTIAEKFWKWFMVKFAGGRNVMLATGGSLEPPTPLNANVKWIFSTSLTEEELRICETRRSYDPKKGARLVIACRQEKEKGTGRVIESLPLILEKIPNTTLDVIGDGGALADFKQLAARMNLSDSITFHGKLNHPSVISILQQADLFCYPTSASEGFPKAVLEALACGLPVVTTRVSVLPQLINQGCGALLQDLSPQTIAQSVCGVLSDAERYQEMSGMAIETARQYSLERWRDYIGEQLRAGWEQESGECLILRS